MKPIWHMVHHKMFQKNTIIFTDKTEIDVPDNVYISLYPGDSTGLQYSRILHEFMGYQLKRKTDPEPVLVEDFNLFFFFPIAPLLFLVPGILFWYKENAVRFYLLYFATCFAYPGLLLHLILREEKLHYIWRFLSGLF